MGQSAKKGETEKVSKKKKKINCFIALHLPLFMLSTFKQFQVFFFYFVKYLN